MRLALDLLFEIFNLGFGYEGLNTIVLVLCRHTKPVHSVCWDVSGDFLASVIEDSVQVGNLGMGSDGECVYELNCNGNNFHTCVFHPNYPSLMFIGCYQVIVSAVCATQCMPDTNLFLALSAALGMSAIMWKCIMESTGHSAQ